MSEILIGAGLALLIGAALAVLIVVLLRRQPIAEPDTRIDELTRYHIDTAARLETMIGSLTHAQGQLQLAVNERLDSVSQRIGDSMEKTKQQTSENLAKLNERLVVIDTAQKNITDLATQMGSLQGILLNKQSRGAFGQGRMEAIVTDGLPKGCYEFQHTLSNKTRPDCAIFFPDKRPLVIDAKFPLEAVTAFREAKSEEDRRRAAAQLRTDMGKHVSDIAEKYLIPGETQDMALMFIPSESVYAELHDGFDDIVQKAYRLRVVLVSPSLLMLAIQVVQQIQKDAQMREAADVIRTEVGHMMKDVRLLGERVRKLQAHFGQANNDLNDIMTSAGRIEKRAARIDDAEFGELDLPTTASVIPAPMTRKLQAGE